MINKEDLKVGSLYIDYSFMKRHNKSIEDMRRIYFGIVKVILIVGVYIEFMDNTNKRICSGDTDLFSLDYSLIPEIERILFF